MKKVNQLIVSSLIGGAIAVAAVGAYADDKHSDKKDSVELGNQVALSMEQAVAIARAQVPGKVIETELEQEDGLVVWEVAVVDENNIVYEFEIDANSGAILEQEIDDD